jgi:hypothetical protein
MVAVREGDDASLVSGCVETVPEVFTGVAPACWTACEGADRSFSLDALTSGETTSITGAVSWYNSLPVTYRTTGGFIDVWESWQMRQTADGYEVTDFTISEPPFNRLESLTTIVTYLGHIERGNWLAAAAMLDDGAIELEERADLQRLAPSTYTQEGIAAALEQWCRRGCDTVVPTAEELAFTGSFSLSRGNERITAAWFEGIYSIAGLPFQTG